jgi:hypothetical protein
MRDGARRLEGRLAESDTTRTGSVPGAIFEPLGNKECKRNWSAAVRPPQQVGLQEPAQNLLLLTRRLGIEGGKAPGEPVGSGVAWPMKHLVSPLRDGESARMSYPLDKVCAAVLLSLAVPATAYAQPCRTQSFSGAQGGPLLLDSVPKARHGTWI